MMRYIYKREALAKLSGATTKQTYSTEIGYLGQLTNSYVLKEYPISRTTVYKTGAVGHSWPNLSDSYIRPLLLNKTYYVAMFANVDTYISDPLLAYNQTIDEKNAVAIVKYTPSYDAKKIVNEFELLSTGQPSNQTEDICYFVKTQAIQ